MIDSNQNKQLLKIGFYSKDTSTNLNLFKDNFDIVYSDKVISQSPKAGERLAADETIVLLLGDE